MGALVNNNSSTATDCVKGELSGRHPVGQKDSCSKADISAVAICTRCTNRGVSYYLTDNNSCRAKCIRAFIVLLATVCAAYVCLLSSRRYFNTWVQTVIERTDVHVSEIPFPAVTICPVKIWDRPHLEREAIKFLKPTQLPRTHNELKVLHMLLNTMNELMWPNMNTMEAVTGDHHLNVASFLEGLSSSPTIAEGESVEPKVLTNPLDTITLGDLMTFFTFECEEIFGECTWRRTKVSCCTLFRKLHTDKGVCYAFNSVMVENPNSSWPLVVSESGLYTGLRVQIKRTSGEYENKVMAMVHDPYETGSSEVMCLDSERVVITINPLRFTADYDIRTVKPEFRHCYFTGEMELWGKSYSNCIRNCRLKYIERSCNCSYAIPQPIKDSAEKTSPMCFLANLRCIYNHRDTLWSTGNVIEEIINDVQLKTWDCKCYPNCNYIQYRTTTYTDNMKDPKRSGNFIDLQVQYQHDTLFSYRSSLCFTLLDLIVSYGGIAALFLGLSLVGIIEVLHDVIMCWKLRNQKKFEVKTILSTTTTTTTVSLEFLQVSGKATKRQSPPTNLGDITPTTTVHLKSMEKCPYCS